MALIVQKYGGASVGDLERTFQRVLRDGVDRAKDGGASVGDLERTFQRVM